MKYKIVNVKIEGDFKEFDVVTEDGGIASIYHNGKNFVTCYYQTRLTDINKENYLWDELSNGKAYFKDWQGEPSQNELVEDALNWLVV